MLLPDPDKGDLFFDYEGDPLWTANGQDWGLEYLWGVLGAEGHFQPLWAHDRASERQVLIDFLDLVRKRRKRFPKMHIYHYAPYERSTLLRLAGRYGVGENDVDDLLRNGILVDLLPLVRKSIRVGTENYSIKSLEPLYMGNELRGGEVTKATDSITEYARYCALRDAGHHDEAATVLKEIEDYNRYDCRSTHRLRDWLINRAFEAGVPPRGPQPVRDGAPIEKADAVDRKLLRFAGDGVEPRTAEQQAAALIAAARGFHKREDKPFWWGHFDRLNNPVDEWADSTGVFVAEEAEVVTDWHIPPRARKPQRQVRLTGAIDSGELGTEVYALYTAPAPAGLSDDPDRRGFGSATVIGCDNPDAPTEVLITERQPTGGDAFTQVPFALTPGPPINTRPLQVSIDGTAASVSAGLPTLPADAVTDILLRRAPRTVSGRPLPRTGETAADITAALLDLDCSYIAVHGPPGTGKTHTSAQIIARLVNEYRWRIGIVAQSHAVIEHLLDQVLDAGVTRRTGRQETQGRRPALDRDRPEPLRLVHRRPSRMRDRRYRMGFRERSPGTTAMPRPAGARRSRPVQSRQHHRGGAGRAQPAAPGRSAATPPGLPGHPSGSSRRFRRWAGWSRVRTRCRPSAATFWTARSGCIRRCAARCRDCPMTVGCSHTKRSVPHATLDGIEPGVRVLEVAAPGQFDRQSRRGRRDRRGHHRIDRHHVDRRARQHAAGPGPRAGGDALQRPGDHGAASPRRGGPDRGAGRHGGQVPGQAGARGVRLDDGVLGRRRAPRESGSC